MGTKTLGLWVVKANVKSSSRALLVWCGLKPQEAIELQDRLRESGEYTNIRSQLEK